MRADHFPCPVLYVLKIITAWSRYEYIVFFIALLLGSVIWAIVQGVVCGIITVGDPITLRTVKTWTR